MSRRRKLLTGFVAFCELNAEELGLVEQKKKKRHMWSREIYLLRENDHVFKKLIINLKNEGEEFYKKFVRISFDDFEYIHERIKIRIQKKDTVLRKAISTGERLAVTLWFLSSGDSFNSLSCIFLIAPCTINGIIEEVCEAIFEELKGDYLKTPSTENEWKAIAHDFWTKWNFPNCIGCLDGKHCLLKKPRKSSSEYYNYKHQFSIVLMAMCDANYTFTYVNIGAKGSASDGGVFALCKFNESLQKGELNIPGEAPLPGRDKPIPYVILADDAFALQNHLMKPYSKRSLSMPERVYNYRLSRARRVIENTFGIASARFRCLRKVMEMGPKKVSKIVSAVCVLHNFCMRRSRNLYAPTAFIDTENNGQIIPGTWRNEAPQELFQLNTLSPQNAPCDAKSIMKEFQEFFVEPQGEVPWQYQMCGVERNQQQP